MNTKKLIHLESLLVEKLNSLDQSKKPNEDILLTKSVLDFILELVEERLHKHSNSNDLIASEEEIDNLTCD